MTVPGKYFFIIHDYYKKCYENMDKTAFKPKHKLPPLVGFSPSFCQQKDVYPNKEEMEKFKDNFKIFSLKMLWQFFVYLYVHFSLCFKLGIGFVNPFRVFIGNALPNTKFTITTVFPELQPRSHLFDKKNKFIGASISDKVNNSVNFASLKDESIKNILETFKIKQEKINILDDDDPKLIYVSLGTVFNNNITIFKLILDAFATFDLEPNETKSKISSNNIKIVVSLCDTCYEKFNDLINKNMYSLPNNILMVKSAPQTEILKRASLFVTHNGMNSTSESIHFGGN